ncbi:MAG: PA0069 family radical SAM protein [Gemmatimonadetes bacterium]|nr:PA0069 family radical SAM protein [Gemmatimonadota bacterium]
MLHQTTPAKARGRGSATNTPNRFEPLHLEPDTIEPDEEDFERKQPTQYFDDASRSILAKNDSPDVGFNYSLNPYRGCEHGCVYCVDGETPILLADGTTRTLATLTPGDEIFGTHRQGSARRYIRTQVLAHWEIEKPAYRITLQDGTELAAAADHRFLTARGWKFVTGAGADSRRRPDLSPKDKLVGSGGFTSVSTTDAHYRHGYLCGVIRAAGSVEYSYNGHSRRIETQCHFRLALEDDEALARTADFLRQIGVDTSPFLFREATAKRQPIHGILTHSRASVEKIRELVMWPHAPAANWSRGYLAGIFDVEGHFRRNTLRISTADDQIMAQAEWALHRLAFPFLVEEQKRKCKQPKRILRIPGGMHQHLRFLHQTRPAIRRKCDIEGTALKSAEPLGIVSIEPVGKMTLFDITTGTGDFIADGVVSHNCYARPTHEYLGLSAGLDFETKILVKQDAPDLLRDTFRKKSWSPQVVALSGNTDCYQPVEKRLEITRQCLEVFLEFRNPVTIITKNQLVSRDTEILQQLAALDLVHVTLSVTSLKPELTGVLEPRTSRPMQRLDAIRTLADAGVPVGINVAPLIPGLNDEEVPNILEAAAQSGAQWANYIMVRLPGAVEPLFLDWLERHMPDRAGKIQSRLRKVREGDLSDPRFTSRMRGEGELADLISRFFTLARKRYGLDGHHHELATEHFRRRSHLQLDLF